MICSDCNVPGWNTKEMYVIRGSDYFKRLCPKCWKRDYFKSPPNAV